MRIDDPTFSRKQAFRERRDAGRAERLAAQDAKREAILALLREGCTHSQISALQDISPLCLHQALKRWGVNGRAIQKARTEENYLSLARKTNQLIHDQLMTIVQAAKELRSSPTTLYLALNFARDHALTVDPSVHCDKLTTDQKVAFIRAERRNRPKCLHRDACMAIGRPGQRCHIRSRGPSPSPYCAKHHEQHSAEWAICVTPTDKPHGKNLRCGRWIPRNWTCCSIHGGIDYMGGEHNTKPRMS